MSQSLPPICLLEPLSLPGRELLELVEERGISPERIHPFHLRREAEHQVAEIDGEPALVPPLDETGQVPEDLPIVIAAPPSEERRSLLAELLRERWDQPVLDLAGTGLVEGPVLAGAPEAELRPPHAVVASPGATVVARLAAPLRDLGLEAVWAAVELPASAWGTEAVERLARQAAARLQGLPPKDAADAPVLAFDLAAGAPGRTTDEVRELLPGVETAVIEARAGVFHGWTVHVGLRFAGGVQADRILAAWESSGTIRFEGEGLRLSGAVESDAVHVGPLVLSGAGRQAVVTAVADGLRVGGAATALEILPALI